MSPEAAPIEMTVTPDRTFARGVWRSDLRQGLRTAGAGVAVALLLIATSLGAVVAEGPWWTVFGLVGLAFGALLLVIVIVWPFQHLPPTSGPLFDPVRYVLAPDSIEWHTPAGTVRLLWSAIGGVRLLPYAYVISPVDGGTPQLICRTTLTALQEAALCGYIEAHAAEKSTTTGA